MQYFNSYQFWPTIRNTIVISLYTILVTFPLPIFLALMCNQIRARRFKKFFQVSTYLPHFISTVVMCGMIILFLSPSTGIIVALMCNQIRARRFKKFFQVSTYLPHFISTVVMCGMIILFLSPSTGIIAKLAELFGITLPNLMGSASAFPSIYVWTEAWQHVGWDSILYIATLSAIDPTLYEAATMDGASKWKRMLHIDVPALLPTATIMFILRMGSVMSVGFEKIYLLQNTLNSSTSEIISTYVYKMGLVSNQYSLSSAIGLFNNVINLILLLLVNYMSKKLNDTSLI